MITTYSEMLAASEEDVGDACIWLSANENRDALVKYTGILDPIKSSKPHFLWPRSRISRRYISSPP
jgi:hypothetical protein